ncbi:soluble lytic murein transglycosylase [Desulfitispora alkaliphila]|uniref:lytic transglycosylase domain-containing protein n=1 Tax=Desulfitispora alkaliphila TaxID=622674 RepID=UPI003D23EB5F
MKAKSYFLIGFFILLFALSITKANIVVSYFYPYHYSELVDEWSHQHEIDPMLTLAVIRAESKFNKEARSPKGALGLMQIMPDTGNWIDEQLAVNGVELKQSDLLDPELNIKLGTWYLARLKQQFGNNFNVTLAAYNAGPGNVTRWITEGIWDGTLTNLDDIPFGETRNYLIRVNRNFYVYENLYEEDLKGIDRYKKNVELLKYLLAKAGF